MGTAVVPELQEDGKVRSVEREFTYADLWRRPGRDAANTTMAGAAARSDAYAKCSATAYTVEEKKKRSDEFFNWMR